MRKFRPPSTTSYAVIFILVVAVLFTALVSYTFKEMADLKQHAGERHRISADEEIKQMHRHILKDINFAARKFSEWEETIQQLSDSTYYSYWRDHRVPTTKFVPEYFDSVVLYDRNGKILANTQGDYFPRMLKNRKRHIFLVGENGQSYLYLFQPISLKRQTDHTIGYLGLKFDYLQGLKAMRHYVYINRASIAVLNSDKPVDEKDISAYLSYRLLPNEDFKSFQTLLLRTLYRFSAIGAGLCVSFLMVVVFLFGLPSRWLARQVDSLRIGDHYSIFRQHATTLPVAEFDKVRLSLIDYQEQLDVRDAALRENESRMRAVLENIVDGIITIDEQGIIESYNPAVEYIFDLKGDLRGKKFIHLIAEQSHQEYYAYTGKVFQTRFKPGENMGMCELKGLRDDGIIIPLEVALAPMFIDDSRLYVVLVRDITERKSTEERLVYLANYDDLTGLPNRTLFRDRLKLAMARAKQYEKLAAIIFIDLDEFKKVNDTLGHHMGDQLILGAAARLMSCIREYDTLARFGGDEFTVILENIEHVDEITHIVKMMLEVLEKSFDLNEQEVFVSASAGITVFPLDDTDLENLVRNADTAMFRAKAQGRNIYEYYTADMNEQAMEKLNLENSLRHALDRNQFCLHYQPKIDLKTSKIVGVEALLRWHHPEMGLLTPARYISIMEETGQIIQVGEWVFRSACQNAAVWSKIVPVEIAVNLSARQFLQKDIVTRFESILREEALDPSMVELEITEGILIENLDLAIKILDDFSALGIRISIDDFGTGYSSMTYLKRLPINTLKIDRSFIKDIAVKPEDAAIVKAIVAMAKSLNLSVVAEGVERKEQVELMSAIGCEQAQGFYFSEALPPEMFEELLRQQIERSTAGISSIPKSCTPDRIILS